MITGLSLLLVLVPARRVFLRVVRFSSLHKNQHFQIPIRPGNSGWKSHPVESTKIPIFSFFIFFLEKDHKLLKVILKKPIHQVPLRLQNMILSITPYALRVKYTPGSQLILVLSRTYLLVETPDQSDLINEKFSFWNLDIYLRPRHAP